MPIYKNLELVCDILNDKESLTQCVGSMLVQKEVKMEKKKKTTKDLCIPHYTKAGIHVQSKNTNHYQAFIKAVHHWLLTGETCGTKNKRKGLPQRWESKRNQRFTEVSSGCQVIITAAPTLEFVFISLYPYQNGGLMEWFRTTMMVDFMEWIRVMFLLVLTVGLRHPPTCRRAFGPPAWRGI